MLVFLRNILLLMGIGIESRIPIKIVGHVYPSLRFNLAIVPYGTVLLNVDENNEEE